MLNKQHVMKWGQIIDINRRRTLTSSHVMRTRTNSRTHTHTQCRASAPHCCVTCRRPLRTQNNHRYLGYIRCTMSVSEAAAVRWQIKLIVRPEINSRAQSARKKFSSSFYGSPVAETLVKVRFYSNRAQRPLNEYVLRLYSDLKYFICEYIKMC